MTDYGRSPERSIVTMLAFDTVGSTGQIADLDPDDAQIYLDKILAYIQGKIEKFGGFVASFHGDGGFGIFGWPHSLEDHADLACEAAWLIQNPPSPGSIPLNPEGNSFEFRVGVHSGLVGFRQLQTGAGSNLDLVGAHVHIAAALQKAAPSKGILVSSDTKLLCKNVLSLEQFESPSARLAKASEYFLLRAAPSKAVDNNAEARYPFAIVGRNNERRKIKAALAPAPARPSSAAIVGEPGIGKSRLALSVVADWQREGHPIMSFAGNARKQTTPFTLAKSFILAALNLDEDVGEGRILEALSGAGIPQTHIAELGASVFRLSEAPEPQIRAQTTKQVATRLVETLSTLTKGTRPHLLVEDVHLVDPESLDFLAMIASSRECDHMATLLTGRPEAGADLSRIARTVLHLDPMRSEDMNVLANRLCEEQGLAKQVVEQAMRQADGVPFVLEQLLVSSRLQSTQPNEQLPQSVESLIHGRLNLLSRRAKSIVQTISVIGDEVELDVAQTLLSADLDELQPSVNELARFGLLRDDIGQTLRFQHSIIATACLNTVPKLKRKSVHKAAVDAITTAYPQSDSQYERLAFHADGAGDQKMALDYLWLAGIQARRSAASASLLTIFRRAIECIENIGDKAADRYVDFVLLSCAALLQIGEFDEMKAAIPKALDIARKRGDADKLCGVLGQIGLLQWFECDYREALKTCTEALALAKQLKSPPLEFAAQLMNASVLHGLGRVEEAIVMQSALCERLTDELASARLGAPAVPSSISHSFLGWFMVEAGTYEEALYHTDHALKTAERHRDPYAEVLARNAEGRVLLQLNRAEDAMRTMLAAKRICDREGFDAINPHVTGRLAAAMARTGSTKMAVQVAGEFAEKTSGNRTGYLETFNLRIGYGEALCRNGQLDQGMEEIDAALAMADKADSPCLKLQALAVRINLLGLRNKTDTQIEHDRKELKRLCEVHGLVAWEPELSVLAHN